MGPRISDSGTESLGARQRHLTREGQGGLRAGLESWRLDSEPGPVTGLPQFPPP